MRAGLLWGVSEMCVEGKLSGSLDAVCSMWGYREIKYPLRRLLNGTPHVNFPLARSRKNHPCEAGKNPPSDQR